MTRKTEGWLDLEYPRPRFDFDRANIIKKIQCVMNWLDVFLKGKQNEVLVLDLGCGTGAFFSELGERKCNIISLDISERDIAKAKDFAQDISGYLGSVVGDVTTPPFKKGVFDVIICSEVLEHLNSPEKAVGIIESLLKDDGVALITVPWLWDICSNAKQAVGNRILDSIYFNKKGWPAKLIFSHIGDNLRDSVLRRYVPSNYKIHSKTMNKTIRLEDFIISHLGRNLEHLGHKHWFTPREWIKMMEENGLKVLYWQGNGKVIPFVAANYVEKIFERILPTKLKNWLSQIIIIVAAKQ